jgi:iron complex outermembrane receptor protein
VSSSVRSARLRAHVSAVLAAVAALPPVAFAADPALEEIVVTARKRDETLLNAPVAITAISERQLEQYNIVQMEDMANLAGGGVLISKNGVSPTLSIRGVSSDSTNAGFDQSVGIIIDGVFYDRSRWVQLGFFDVGQVEILKGPQSLYFGKSTVAGALVMSTANPTDELTGKASVGYEMEGREIYGEGVISGPLTDTVSARLALRASDMDGWLKNDAPGITDDRFGGLEDYNGRVTLAWDPSEDFSLNWKVQANFTEDDGPATRAQLYNCRGPFPNGTDITNIQADTALPGNFGVVFGAYYPTADNCKLDDRITVYAAPPGLEYGDKPYNETDAYLTSLNMDWQLGSVNLTGVLGYSNYDLEESTGYISSQGLITAFETEENTAYSAELRALTQFDGPLNFLLGVNYQETEFEFRNTSQIILAIPDTRNGRATSQDHIATQDGTSVSVFGEVTWDITDTLQFSGGARYSDETKDAAYDVTFVNEWFGILFGTFWLPEGTRFANEFKDDDVSPQATLRWQPTENLNFFVSYKSGFLPGGFSLGATPQAGLTLDDFLFESEDVEGYEIGMKGLALDGRLSYDIVAYTYDFTNLQVNLYVPATASFIVGNAGEAKTRGVEAGLRWQATDYFSLRALATYNKGTFEEYRTACYTLQTAEQGCTAIDPSQPTVTSQDVSGKPLPRAPEFTFGLGTAFTAPVTDNWNFNFNFDALYSDDYMLEQTNNPFLRQEAYTRIDASVALESSDNAWRIALFGRNLTDEAIASFGATRGFTNDQLAEILRLRTVTFEVTRNF